MLVKQNIFFVDTDFVCNTYPSQFRQRRAIRQPFERSF